MRALLVVNPNATTTTVAARDVLAHALASELKLEVLETAHRGHAATAAEHAAQDGVELVVVHGGDGTVNEVVNGLLAGTGGPLPDPADGPAVAVVPGGSANVFARALGAPGTRWPRRPGSWPPWRPVAARSWASAGPTASTPVPPPGR